MKDQSLEESKNVRRFRKKIEVLGFNIFNFLYLHVYTSPRPASWLYAIFDDVVTHQLLVVHAKWTSTFGFNKKK